MIYVHSERVYACVPLPPSMKYFHWFHGQQTRLHDANNTLHGAVVPFTSLPRGRADRTRKISRKEREREKNTRKKERDGEKEQGSLRPELVLRPVYLATYCRRSVDELGKTSSIATLTFRQMEYSLVYVTFLSRSLAIKDESDAIGWYTSRALQRHSGMNKEGIP